MANSVIGSNCPPVFLLLDEPSSHLDLSSLNALESLLNQRPQSIHLWRPLSYDTTGGGVVHHHHDRRTQQYNLHYSDTAGEQ